MELVEIKDVTKRQRSKRLIPNAEFLAARPHQYT
jgi:hypothetical protein